MKTKEIETNGIPVFERYEEAVEVARIWIVDGKPTFLIGTPLWDKPELWGLLISDLMRHVANAYASEGVNREFALQKIMGAFNVEMNHPTSDAEGPVVDRD
jgi:hypothetical protein